MKSLLCEFKINCTINEIFHIAIDIRPAILLLKIVESFPNEIICLQIKFKLIDSYG